MRALKRRYPVVPLSRVVSSLAQGETLRKAVVVTFDDGYRNNARYAAPVLKRLGLPYAVFVATAYVESGRWIPLNQVYWLWSEGRMTQDEMAQTRKQLRSRQPGEAGPSVAHYAPLPPVSVAAEESFAMLSWDEIREMARAGAEFGSHTHTHCNMAVASEREQETELMVSKQLLESKLGSAVSLFAYPYGHAEQMSETARANVIRAGYDCALSAEYGLATGRSDRFSLPRLGYNQRQWMFAGEILYQFMKQALKDRWAGWLGRPAPAKVSATRQQGEHDA
jgi:peptidoglycan/xylan/chitin deacetylase (PgdA/CDA1 family)